MKILHTSDWHLGHRLHEYSQKEEQILFLEWLKQFIIDQEIDILLISGDIFDTGIPSTQSQKMYYDFLISLQNTSCKHIVIIAGNHDSPGTINAPKDLLKVLSVHVVGKATENICDETFEIKVNNEHLIIAAIPYLRDQDIRKAVEGENFDDITKKYKQALINHYKTAADYIQKQNSKNYPVIAMGHLFAIGGAVSDSEQNIYVGSLGHIGADDFPDNFDYIALGHLHRPQYVGGSNSVRYSGSPYILSFSELNYNKEVVVLDVQSDEIKDVKSFELPRFREFARVEGDFETCSKAIASIKANKIGLTPWVEVIVDSTDTLISSKIQKIAEDLPIEILKVSLKAKKKNKG